MAEEVKFQKVDGKSLDIEAVDKEKLKKIFPQCFNEGKLDINKLLSLCGEYIDNDFEKYKFEWKGKSECYRIAGKRSTGTLRPCPKESVDFENTNNLYIEGDNLEVLKLLQTAYYCKVKMIYIDPPYNTGNDFVYEDDFKDPLAKYKEITSQTTKSNPETMGRYHTNWLNMMYPRLRLAAIHFIDETVLPDAESFYKRYFRKPENYGELSAWVSKFAFRTLKSQVQQYVNFTRRLPIVLNYIPEDKEKKLYDLIQKYLAIADKQAYPQMDNYQLTLRFYHTLSSSPQALASMLAAPIERTRDSERIVLTAIRDLAAQIPVNAKMQALLSALNKVFAHLKFRREAQKAIVFTDNSVTAEVLSGFLQTNKYNVVKYTDDDALKQFRNDKSLQILIANDAIAKGLDIEYCPVVVNYDLLYNAVEMEQRICRCHRQGQKSDVLVINLLSQENFSDVRILELINKRTLQFDGIFGMSDNIVDNFDISLDELLARRRPFADIERDFEHNLAENKKSNEQTVASAEDALFTTFTKEIADKFAVSPQYIQEQADKINEDLWEVVKYYFQVNFPQYIIDDTARTLTLPDNEEPPHLFYYNSGTRNVPYTGRRAYGMSKDFKPAAGRISLTSVLVQGILSEISCYTEGEIIVDALLPSCEISCFNVDVTAGKTFIKSADVLTGKNGSGRNLDDIECRRILNLPVVKYSETGKSVAYWLTIATSGSFGKTLDIQTEEKIKEDIFNDKRKNFAADIDLIKMRAAREKTLLEQKINETKQKVTQTRNKLSEVNDRLEELKIQKQLNLLEKELRKKEEGLFFDQMQIDVQTEEKIDNLTGTANLKIKATNLFEVKIQGKV